MIKSEENIHTPFCIIGTDTGIGKTYTTCQILSYLGAKQQSIAALKPIASGSMKSEIGWVNEDVYQIYHANPYRLDLNQINCFSFDSAIAPHIAAAAAGIELSVATIISRLMPIVADLAPRCQLLIEGVGGLMVPLNQEQTYLDLLASWRYPAIVVIGMKLGCLNHSLLTLAMLKTHNIPVVGWIANYLDPNFKAAAANFTYLQEKLTIPCLATIAYTGQLQPLPPFKELFQCN